MRIGQSAESQNSNEVTFLIFPPVFASFVIAIKDKKKCAEMFFLLSAWLPIQKPATQWTCQCMLKHNIESK